MKIIIYILMMIIVGLIVGIITHKFPFIFTGFALIMLGYKWDYYTKK